MPIERPNEKTRQGRDLEEQYERLYGKIGRDFVHIDDLNDLILLINMRLGLVGAPPIPLLKTSKAATKGILYKEALDSGKDASKIFKDIVNMDAD